MVERLLAAIVVILFLPLPAYLHSRFALRLASRSRRCGRGRDQLRGGGSRESRLAAKLVTRLLGLIGRAGI